MREMPWQWVVTLATLALALGVSLVTDLRRRLILNAVTLPAFVICAACLGWLGGWPLLVDCALACAICTVPFLLAWRFGAMGAGDVKLIAVCGLVAGGWDGYVFGLTVLLYVTVAGGGQAVLWILAARVRGREKPKYVPYGVAIALGTAAAFWFGEPLF